MHFTKLNMLTRVCFVIFVVFFSFLGIRNIIHELDIPNDKHTFQSSGLSKKRIQDFYQLPKGTQMGIVQVREICSVLPRDGNLLVWGIGYDSRFWNNLTTGKTVFIEDNKLWINRITNKYKKLQVVKVTYTSKNILREFWKHPDQWQSKLDISSQLPHWISLMHWHVIIVDAPAGHIGRYQSIYTSYLLARNNTHVFVDDYERKLENEISRTLLGEPYKVVTRQANKYRPANTLAHYMVIFK